MTYIFESDLAHHIEGLIQQKRADGYAYHSEEELLKRFDVTNLYQDGRKQPAGNTVCEFNRKCGGSDNGRGAATNETFVSGAG